MAVAVMLFVQEDNALNAEPVRQSAWRAGRGRGRRLGRHRCSMVRWLVSLAASHGHYKHGMFTCEAMEARRVMRELIREAREPKEFT